MEGSTREGPDDSSLKPVSSLRARFENLDTPATTPQTPRSPLSKGPPPVPRPKPATSNNLVPRLSRTSLDLQPEQSDVAPSSDQNKPKTSTNQGSSTPPEPRPKANGATRATNSEIRVDITSPGSPPKSLKAPKPPLANGSKLSPAPQATLTSKIALSQSVRLSSNALDIQSEPQDSSSAPAVDAADFGPSLGRSHNASAGASSQPPPINRAAKPFVGSEEVEQKVKSLALKNGSPVADCKISPFNTPPSSNEGSPHSGSPPPIPSDTKPRNSPSPFSVIQKQPQLIEPVYSTSNTRRSPAPAPPPSRQSRMASVQKKDSFEDTSENSPGLPPRVDSLNVSTHTRALSSSQSMTRQSLEIVRPSSFSRDFSPITVPERKSSYSGIGTSSKFLSQPDDQRRPSRTIAPRPLSEARYSTSSTPHAGAPKLQHHSKPSHAPPISSSASEFPDSSQANRRPPYFRDGPQVIPTGYDARLLGVCGEFVCTTGILTRVWELLSGRLVFSIPQAENVKVTALAFKPARKIEEEGTRIWLGTNAGELQEIDVEGKRVVSTNASAHPRKKIVKIYRHADQLWTLDEEGKFYVWPTTSDGSPSLDFSIYNGRVPKGHSSSVIVGKRLWVASGKAVRIFQPSIDPTSMAFQVTQHSIAQPGLGDITSCTLIPDEPDRVYFGHSDGKISAYSRKTLEFLEVTNATLYKINCLVGVGSHLWAGFNTGMILMYDTKSHPWKTKKRWQGHSNPVLNIVADGSSLWKLDRLQVVSLGVDNMIAVWDGLLEDDRMEDDMQSHETEFSTYREITAVVMTWNAGASKPQDLRYDEQNSNFFRDLLRAQEPPDILVFGLQELVDLDDKKLTAKSFFKSKSKDSYGQENLSRAYRAWRDHLTGCIDDSLPPSEHYTLLHSASLVGLFSCIFVKASIRTRIRDVQAAEVKTGMGGLHGNKGSLLLRFTLEDTTFCLANCHLAAGQTQTVNRNHDVSAILEYPHLPLPPVRLNQSSTNFEDCSSLFVNGGDGTLVMDHEICIFSGDLNYRIDTMTRDTVIHAIKAKNLQKLVDRDQLLLSRRKNPNFRLRDFEEGKVDFCPTYKYDVGTDNYDSSDKKRAPAWCDRILFRAGGFEGGRDAGGKIRLLDYGRHEVRVSDHRPVSALFAMRVKTVSQERRAQCRYKAEQRFEKVKQAVAEEAKLDYLTNVFGLSLAEAHQLLSP